MRRHLYIAIAYCPVHPDSRVLLIEQSNGGGYRLVGAKCCGQWVTSQRWKAPSTADYGKARRLT